MVRVYAAALLVATLFAVFTRTFLVQAFVIPSASMEPGLSAGDHVLVNKLIYRGTAATRASTPPGGTGGRRTVLPQRDVRRGDVVVFATPQVARRTPYRIKRCVALPGETVELASGTLWIDGKPIDEDAYLYPGDDPAPAPGFGPATVPAGHYFFLGDHRDRSRDSRSWGPVAAERLVGRAVLVYWSVRPRTAPAADGVAAEGAWSKMRRSIHLPGEWLRRCRWDRCLRPVH